MRKYIFLFSAFLIFLPMPAYTGDLEPTDPPGSTMNTLDHIYTQNEEIYKKLLDDNPVIVTKTGQTISYTAAMTAIWKKELLCRAHVLRITATEQ